MKDRSLCSLYYESLKTSFSPYCFSRLLLATSFCSAFLANHSSEFVLYHDTQQSYPKYSNNLSLTTRSSVMLQLSTYWVTIALSALISRIISTISNTNALTKHIVLYSFLLAPYRTIFQRRPLQISSQGVYNEYSLHLEVESELPLSWLYLNIISLPLLLFFSAY